MSLGTPKSLVTINAVVVRCVVFVRAGAKAYVRAASTEFIVAAALALASRQRPSVSVRAA